MQPSKQRAQVEAMMVAGVHKLTRMHAAIRLRNFAGALTEEGQMAAMLPILGSCCERLKQRRLTGAAGACLHMDVARLSSYVRSTHFLLSIISLHGISDIALRQLDHFGWKADANQSIAALRSKSIPTLCGHAI